VLPRRRPTECPRNGDIDEVLRLLYEVQRFVSSAPRPSGEEGDPRPNESGVLLTQLIVLSPLRFRRGGHGTRFFRCLDCMDSRLLLGNCTPQRCRCALLNVVCPWRAGHSFRWRRVQLLRCGLSRCLLALLQAQRPAFIAERHVVRSVVGARTRTLHLLGQ